MMSGRDAQGGAVMTLGATHGRDFGCYHSLSDVPLRIVVAGDLTCIYGGSLHENQ